MNSPEHTSARALTPAGALLGEAPRWDPDCSRLLWVDLWGGLLNETEPDTGDTLTVELAPPLSSVLLTTRGTRVLTAGLCIVELEDGVPRHLADLPEEPCLRANDAAVDPAGRLWVGTMPMPHRLRQATGSLWRLEPGERPVRVLTDVRLANGLAWSPSGDLLYFVDSLRQRVTAYAYDSGTGNLGPGAPIAQIPNRDGMPDGIAVDASGGIWVALAGGATVRRYTQDGEITHEIDLPVQFPTSCAFGGPSLERLFITSGVRPIERDQRPAAVEVGAGAVFAVPVNFPGVPTNQMRLWN